MMFKLYQALTILIIGLYLPHYSIAASRGKSWATFHPYLFSMSNASSKLYSLGIDYSPVFPKWNIGIKPTVGLMIGKNNGLYPASQVGLIVDGRLPWVVSPLVGLLSTISFESKVDLNAIGLMALIGIRISFSKFSLEGGYSYSIDGNKIKKTRIGISYPF